MPWNWPASVKIKAFTCLYLHLHIYICIRWNLCSGTSLILFLSKSLCQWESLKHPWVMHRTRPFSLNDGNVALCITVNLQQLDGFAILDILSNCTCTTLNLARRLAIASNGFWLISVYQETLILTSILMLRNVFRFTYFAIMGADGALLQNWVQCVDSKSLYY